MRKLVILLLAGSLLAACKPQEKPVTKPTVVTGEITDITGISATVEGDVTETGGADVTERGICWSLAENPTKDDNVVDAGEGPGQFTGDLNGLAPETTYFVRAFASNSEGTSYGEEKWFTTLASNDSGSGSFTDERDNREYQTVTIGDQEWMAENLKYLPQVDKEVNKTGPAYYILGYEGDVNDLAAAKSSIFTSNKLKNDIVAYEELGVYYNHMAAQTACPEGWRLPSITDWDGLVTPLGGKFSAGFKLMLKDEDFWTNPVANATNSSGFNGRMTARLWLNKDNLILASFGEEVRWWSSTSNSAGNYQIILIHKSSSLEISEISMQQAEAAPVRCIRD